MRLLAALALLPVLALSACGDDSSVPTYSQSGTAITVQVGKRFQIELESNLSTGYSWQLAQAPGDQLTLIDDDYVGKGGQPGAAGVQRFEFQGAAAGSTTLTFNYLRPWEQGTAPAKTATFPVTVT